MAVHIVAITLKLCINEHTGVCHQKQVNLLLTYRDSALEAVYEPKLKCYECRDCDEKYSDTGVECDPRFFFCIYLVKPSGAVDRLCGVHGNCTGLLEPGGNCSMCSADLCNSQFNTNAGLACRPINVHVHLLWAFVFGSVWAVTA